LFCFTHREFLVSENPWSPEITDGGIK